MHSLYAEPHPKTRAPQAACEQRQVTRCVQNQQAPQLSVNADATRCPTAKSVTPSLTCHTQQFIG